MPRPAEAGLEFGSVPEVQESVREAWVSRWLDTLVRDVHYAIRSLTQSWGFALGAGAVLALAIGASTTIFSVVNTVLPQPLPYYVTADLRHLGRGDDMPFAYPQDRS